jgi:uncharacterized membrane protein YidH (DUF202 family)
MQAPTLIVFGMSMIFLALFRKRKEGDWKTRYAPYRRIYVMPQRVPFFLGIGLIVFGIVLLFD